VLQVTFVFFFFLFADVCLFSCQVCSKDSFAESYRQTLVRSVSKVGLLFAFPHCSVWQTTQKQKRTASAVCPRAADFAREILEYQSSRVFYHFLALREDSNSARAAPQGAATTTTAVAVGPKKKKAAAAAAGPAVVAVGPNVNSAQVPAVL
jgi:hypothetical protein